jgi:hypothetical protein
MGMAGLAKQLYGDAFPDWLRDAIQKVTQTYLRLWPAPKYFIVRKGNQWYTPDQVRSCPGGPPSNINGYILFEIAMRWGGMDREIRAHKAAIEFDYASRPEIHPWASGLMGCLQG